MDVSKANEINKPSQSASYSQILYVYKPSAQTIATITLVVAPLLIALGPLLHHYAGLGTTEYALITSSGCILFVIAGCAKCAKDSLSPLQRSVYRGDKKALETYYQVKGSRIFEEKNAKGENVLHPAVFSKDAEMVREVLELAKKEAPEKLKQLVNEDSEYGSPLFCAVNKENPNPAVIALLLENGADAKDLFNRQSLDEIVNSYKPEIISLLFKKLGKSEEEIVGTALAKACIKNKVETLRAILEASNIDIGPLCDSSGNTLLHYAAFHGSKECIILLLEKCPDLLNAQNKVGETALHTAVKNNKLNCVQALIEAKANVNLQEASGLTPFLLAVTKEKLELYPLFLEAPGIDLTLQNSKLHSVIHIAACDGDTQLCKALLEKNNNLINLLGGRFNLPPALYALMSDRVETFFFLIESGGSIAEHCPLLSSIAYKSEKCLRKILERNKDEDFINKKFGEIERTPLQFAAFDKNSRAIEIILEFKPDLNLATEDGKTALHLAVEADDPRCIELLIDANADVNAKEKTFKLTPFELAIDLENITAIETFVTKKKVDLNSEPYLHYSMVTGKVGALKALIQLGANIDKVDEKGLTPLTWLLAIPTYLKNCSDVIHKNIDCLKEILKANPDINFKTPLNDMRPLHLACLYGNREIVSLILEKKPLLNETDEAGRTPLFYADDESKQLLIKAGADENILDNEGKSAKEVAPNIQNLRKTHRVLDGLSPNDF